MKKPKASYRLSKTYPFHVYYLKSNDYSLVLIDAQQNIADTFAT